MPTLSRTKATSAAPLNSRHLWFGCLIFFRHWNDLGLLRMLAQHLNIRQKTEEEGCQEIDPITIL